jgi:DNA-binding LytR/AlgR family response regulator
MVNINYIDKIEGSSQGYKLFIENVNFPVPVSKGSVDKLKELI